MPASNRQRKALNASLNHHGRHKTDEFVAEGLRCCREALQRQPQWLHALFFSQTFANSKDAQELEKLSPWQPEIISDKEFMDISGTPAPQGVVALLQKPSFKQPAALSDSFVLILDHISEPGNLGTILRTSWAVGLSQVWLVKGCADPFAPKVVRSGMGAQFALELPAFDTLAEAVKHFKSLGGNKIWMTLPQASISLFDEQAFTFLDNALVIGNEANGVSDASLGTGVTIPMPGQAESLNAAQATTVFLFEAVRRGVMNS